MRPTCKRCEYRAPDPAPREDFEYDGWTFSIEYGSLCDECTELVEYTEGTERECWTYVDDNDPFRMAQISQIS